MARSSSRAPPLSAPPDAARTNVSARTSPKLSAARAKRSIISASSKRSGSTRRTLDLAPDLALFDRLSFVMHLLAFAESKLHLGAVLPEIQTQRQEREPLLLQLAGEPLQLGGMARALGVAAQEVGGAARLGLREERALSVGWDVHPRQPRLAALDANKTIHERATTR